ncbi:response regulator transcription factor [Vreelandella venusta]|uniref:response regulator n=1 Tax=Vreelandella venusta TaxID=44935 RepID=UPI00384C353B
MSSHNSAGATIRVVVVNESGFIREGLCRVLERFPQVEVVASVSCPDLLDAITRSLPVDVALIDAQFPGQAGFEVIQRLRSSSLGTRVVILSVNPSLAEVERVMQAGAHGFLLREAGVDELEVALHAAAKGEMFLCPTILQRLFGHTYTEALPLDALRDTLEKALRLGILQSER